MSYKKRIAAVISFVLATALLTLTASSNVVAQSARMGNGDWQPGCVLVYRSGSFELATANSVEREANSYVLIHGAHAGAETQEEFSALAEALLARDPSANILFVDWAYWSKLNMDKCEEILSSQAKWLGATLLFTGIIDVIDEIGGDGTAVTEDDYGAVVMANVAIAVGRILLVLLPVDQTSKIPTVADRAYSCLFGDVGTGCYWTTNDQESCTFEELGLDPERTHIIGHSHGAHVGGLICKRVATKLGKRVSRLSALDPSTSAVHLSGENQFGNGWDRNVATFVDTYRTSDYCCEKKAYGDYNMFCYTSNHPARRNASSAKSNSLSYLRDLIHYDIGLHSKAIEVFSYMVGREGFLEARSFLELDKGQHRNSEGEWITVGR